jgi:hypothetical protein
MKEPSPGHWPIRRPSSLTRSSAHGCAPKSVRESMVTRFENSWHCTQTPGPSYLASWRRRSRRGYGGTQEAKASQSSSTCTTGLACLSRRRPAGNWLRLNSTVRRNDLPRNAVSRQRASQQCGARHISVSRVAVFGMTTCVGELVGAAVEARRVAQTAIEVAVREARSVHWSSDQISAALGGNPNQGIVTPQVLLRRDRAWSAGSGIRNSYEILSAKS